MADSLSCLQWESMTATLNEIKSPNSFLKKKLFGAHLKKPTHAFELSLYTRGRKIAPFVKVDAAAVMTTGHGATGKVVNPTNIRIKRPFTPSELLFGRRPGTAIFIDGQGTVLSEARKHVAMDLAGMGDDISNAEEYLCSLAISTGVIAYETTDGESYTLDFSKPAGNIIVLTGDRLWDTADATLPQIEQDVLDVKRVLSAEVGLAPTDVLLGSEAAEHFIRVCKSNPLLEQRRLITGTADVTGQFNEDGVIYLGNVCGLNWWEYSRSADLDGVDTPMIRAKYAEFVCATPAAKNTLFYGAIPDLKTLRGGNLVSERFSKSWEQEDPSVMWALAASCPLPVTQRSGSTVSMKVVSG